jgi:hypothetical protein
MEISDFGLRWNTLDTQKKSSMTIQKNLDPPYDSFGKGSQTSVCINSNTSVDLDSTGFGTVCLDFDKAHGLQVKVDGQSRIKYRSC